MAVEPRIIRCQALWPLVPSTISAGFRIAAVSRITWGGGALLSTSILTFSSAASRWGSSSFCTSALWASASSLI